MTREILRRRSAFTAATRAFFSDRGYLETETPILAPALIPESAIEVFRTRFEHPYRPGRDMYLIPSPELWMKRLIAAGMGDIFQITRAFRNAESVGRLHNPEFTILEYYTAGADHLASIDVTEELFRHLLSRGLSSVPDAAALSPPFRRMTMAEAFREFAGFDLAPCSASDLAEQARRLGIRPGGEDDWETAFNRIFVDRVEPALPADRPLVLLDYPREVRCLAREIPGTPWRERWELYVSGIETANCYSEETDPGRVAAYFREEEARKARALVPHPADGKFVSLYRDGYPSCSGVAVGFDRLIMAFFGIPRIEGVILFPFSDILSE
jgi:lysyl-tRNA synthetase class 2